LNSMHFTLIQPQVLYLADHNPAPYPRGVR